MTRQSAHIWPLISSDFLRGKKAKKKKRNPATLNPIGIYLRNMV